MNKEEADIIEESDRRYIYAEACIQICSYTEKHPWYDCSYASECLKKLQFNEELSSIEYIKLEEMWRLLYSNPFKGSDDLF